MLSSICPHTREVPGVVADSQSRPADILLPTLPCCGPATLDVHVASLSEDLTLHESTCGRALIVGMQCKMTARAHLTSCPLL